MLYVSHHRQGSSLEINIFTRCCLRGIGVLEATASGERHGDAEEDGIKPLFYLE